MNHSLFLLLFLALSRSFSLALFPFLSISISLLPALSLPPSLPSSLLLSLAFYLSHTHSLTSFLAQVKIMYRGVALEKEWQTLQTFDKFKGQVASLFI